MILKEIFCYALVLLNLRIFPKICYLYGHIPFLPRCLYKYCILFIAKDTSLFKAFTSKNQMPSDVIVIFKKMHII